MRKQLTHLTLLALATVMFTAVAAAEYAGPRGIFRDHVGRNGAASLELTEATGWSSVQAFSWQMYLVDDLTGASTVTRYNRDFRTEQAFKLKVEAHTDLWIYVMNVEPNGKMITLLPELGEQHLLVQAGKSVLVPPDGNFRFVGDPGTEKFRIIASPTKLKWVNPETLWRMENGAQLPPDEQRVALAQAASRSKSINNIAASQSQRQKATGGLFAKSLPDLVDTLKKNPNMRGMVKDVVLVPPPTEGDEPAVEDQHRQDVILVSDEQHAEDAIVIDINLKHGR
ncbi:MAG: DUF4384 domain-containing protein [Planctomycetales bacterium]|nr:DUF4384 domain-containing protein [Planctomycetales bacterium]